MKANENQYLNDREKSRIIKKVSGKFKAILKDLQFEVDGDPQMEDTPNRWAKMMVNEVLDGSYSVEPSITVFPNTKDYNQMIFDGPITVKSLCSHHFQHFLGKAYIAYIPGEQVCGLSKLSRIVNWFARRPQIQEELTEQIKDFLVEKLHPSGVAVLIKANHLCAHVRGVQEHESNMITCALTGPFSNVEATRNEFYKMVELSERG